MEPWRRWKRFDQVGRLRGVVVALHGFGQVVDRPTRWSRERWDFAAQTLLVPAAVPHGLAVWFPLGDWLNWRPRDGHAIAAAVRAWSPGVPLAVCGFSDGAMPALIAAGELDAAVAGFFAGVFRAHIAPAGYSPPAAVVAEAIGDRTGVNPADAAAWLAAGGTRVSYERVPGDHFAAAGMGSHRLVTVLRHAIGDY